MFLTHLCCIIYLMNSGEEFIIQFAKSAGLTHTLLKIQFFIMSMCYVGLAYSCVAQHDIYQMILDIAKQRLSLVDYWLGIVLYIVIHLLWCTHFIDLSVRAHVYKHSKSGVYSTMVTRTFLKIIHFLFSHIVKSKHNGKEKI